MGMSASQMRYCMITGRKSDVEFQGQQINQQRTTLATQSAAYNTQLLSLSVPTPPSTSDYSKTTYSFSSNGQTCSVSGTVFDKNTGTYTVNYTVDTTTSAGKSGGSSTFGKQMVNGSPVYTTNQGTVLTKVITDSTDSDYNATDITNTSLITQDCGKPSNSAYYKYTSGGTTKYVTEAELSANAGTTTAISSYYVDNNATASVSGKLTGANVTWSDTGRMSSITDSSGKEYTLNITTATDSDAYNNAMNEYNYQKDSYDQEMNNINSKISIIEAQDKKLELKLKDLDTQQQALNTELDAVKKVVNNNIEKSFKTFNA